MAIALTISMDSNEALEAVATVVCIGSGAIGSTHLHLIVSERGQTREGEVEL